jgi:exopolysaccharide biosynthesis protein
MKKILKRGLALCLALCLIVPQVFASDALGSDRYGRTVELAAGTTVTENSLWSATYSDLRTERYVTYTPSSSVTPVVWYGSTVVGTAKLTTAAARLEAQGYRVVAGINGGFFNSDGTAVGLVMSDGVIRRLNAWNGYMVGFGADGSVFIDGSSLTEMVSWTSASGGAVKLSLAAINGSRNNGGLYLYTDDFGTSTQNTLAGVDVILEPVTAGAQLTMNGSVTLKVVRVIDSTQEGVSAENVIPSGCFVLSANQNCDASLLDSLRALTAGTQVTVSISGGDSRWANAVYGVSGMYSLVENGKAVSGLADGAAPRTALGVKQDGSVVFYTIDGRQSGYSIGATLTQVAKRLIELGCVQAVALDGGGSTSLGATLPGADSFSLLNSPSGGAARSVHNSILLVTRAAESTQVSSFYVEPAQKIILTGGQTTLTAKAVGENGGSVSYSGSVAWSAEGGSVSAGGVFTAGSTTGTYSVTASAEDASGSAPVRVVDALSKLTITRRSTGKSVTSLSLQAGDTVELDASGTWYNLSVGMTDQNVVWKTTGGVGTIDQNGTFTAGKDTASGTITATAGGKTVTISVKVERTYPFADISSHWSRDYVARLYELGLTTGSTDASGAKVYRPDGQLTRGELMVFISRLLGVDTAQYESVALPFTDAASIPDWMRSQVKAMYALGVLTGSEVNGGLYADVNSPITREQAMTMLGRVLAQQTETDLSGFADAGKVSSWASPYVQTLVAQGIVSGSGGYLNPGSNITRGEMAKILVLVSDLTLKSLD